PGGDGGARTVTCSASLKEALGASTIEPCVRVVLSLGESSLTYAQDRVLSVEETREPYTHTAEIMLDNSDGQFTPGDLRGYRAVIGWGAATSEGDEYCDSPPLRVVRQELVSHEGVLTCRLACIGVPEQLAEDRASASYLPGADDTTVLQSLINAILSGTLAPYSHCAAVDYTWDSADALATGYRPRDGFRLYMNGSRLAAVRRLLDFTNCVGRVESDGQLHFFQPTTGGEDFDHEFSLEAGSHSFLQKAGRQTLVIPNRVEVMTPQDAPVTYSGSATDTTSYALLPKVQYQVAAVGSDVEAGNVASAILSKHRLETPVAKLTVPLAPFVQPLDYVKISDARLGDSVTGNVGSVRHRWWAKTGRARVIWQTEIELGGWSSVRSLANRLEVYPTPQGYDRLGRLSVKDLEAENIRAGNIVLEWLQSDGAVDLSKVGDTLDSLPDGDWYGKLRSTNISAGNILLSSLVQVKTGTSSRWYDVGYIEIDADTGLTISGQDLIFEYGTEEHYIYPSSGELDIMSESGCDIRFLNGPVKLSCDLDPKSNGAYDLGMTSYRFDDVYCTDLHVTNEPWDHADDLALVRGIRADAKDARKYDRSTIPPMLKTSHRKTEKVARRRERIDRDDEELRQRLLQAAEREARPEKKAKLLARCTRVGVDREEKLRRYEASLDDDTTLSVGNSLGLLFGAVRQLADFVDALSGRLEAMEKTETA
ncbi:MAG: hypothetical protein ACOC9B_07875, partial [Chloroflexota bacterium]